VDVKWLLKIRSNFYMVTIIVKKLEDSHEGFIPSGIIDVIN
jgi:hypothetical protein